MPSHLGLRLAAVALAFAALSASAADVAGTVSSVQDGDTLTFSHSAATSGCACSTLTPPPFGEQPAASLRELCQSKPATLDGTGTDRYGRVLARVTCAGVDANAEQARRGMAWVFERYAPND